MRYTPFIIVPLLSACSFSFMKFDNDPLVQATYATNATKSSVIAAGGKPDSEMNVPEINGTCINYTLKKDAETMPFYVAFDENGNRKHYGYISCHQARAKGIFSQ
ncbi:DNA-binding transcriptional activator OsmE [compost metagenome]